MAAEAVTITITETAERSYRITGTDLAGLSLPTTADELQAIEDDVLGVALIDSEIAHDYAVVDRTVEIVAPKATPNA